METPLNYKHGHRSRVKERFLREGIDTFADYEILEFLLFFAIPRRDTKDMAHALMREFSTLDAVLGAKQDELCRISGIGPHVARFLSSLFPFANYALKQEKRPMAYECEEDIGRLFKRFFSEHPELATAALLLDNSHQPLRMVRCPHVSGLAQFANHIPFLIEQAYSINAPVIVLAERVLDGNATTILMVSDVARDIQRGLSDAGVSLLELISVSPYGQPTLLLRHMEGSLCRADAFDAISLIDARTDFGVDNSETKEKLFSFLSHSMRSDEAKRQSENLLSVYPSLISAAIVPHDTLTQTDGVSSATAMLIKLAFGAYARAKTAKALKESKCFLGANELGVFFTDVIGSRPVETMALALFDEKMKLISVKLLGSGTVNATVFAYRTVMEETIKHKARYAALAHNHPLGVITPSSHDISITTEAERLFHSVDVGFVGHAVVTEREHYFIPRPYFVDGKDAPEGFFK